MKTLDPKTTLGVTCSGNIRALCMMLLAAYNSPFVPHKALIRLEGPDALTDDFYLAQTLDYLRQCGSEVLITVANSNGIRAARDWLIDNCSTQWLWMVDDDVIPRHNCLENFSRTRITENTFAIQGSKTDLNNRRGYADFNNYCHPRSDLKDGVSPNHHWEELPVAILRSTSAELPSYKLHTIDTGNVLFSVDALQKHKLRFEDVPLSANSGGEDTLMAVKILMAGGEVRFNPWAASIHLEKPNIKFNEHAARGQMVYEACLRMGVPPDILDAVRAEIMPWVWPKVSTGELAKLPKP